MCSFGSSSNSAPSSQFSTQTTTADPRAQAMYGQAWQNALQVGQRPFVPYSQNPTDFVAPLNQTQIQATNNISGMQGAADPYFNAGAGMAMASGNTPTYGVVGNYMNPYMSQVVDPVRAAIEQQQGMQRSKLTGDQIKSGNFGQERGQLMRAVLAGQQNLGLGQAMSPLYQDAFKTASATAQGDLNRQLQAGQTMGQLGQSYSQTGLGAAQALLGAGTLGQQTDQAGKQALYNQFLMQQQYPFQVAQFLSTVAGGLGPGYGGTTSGFQTSLQPLSAMGMPMSDPRLKEGVEGEKSEPEVIGETNDGQKIYRYRLINPDTGELGPVQIGLMADEVEERSPEAVGEYNGYKTLDYERATDGAARVGKADGGGIDDLLRSHEAMYQGLGKAVGSIVPESKMVTAKLDTPTLSYQQQPQQKKQGLGDVLGEALNLVKQGKEIYSVGSSANDTLEKANLAPKLGINIFGESVSGRASGGVAGEPDDVEMTHGPEVTQQPTAKLDAPELSFGAPEKKREGTGLRDVLGMIGDVVKIGATVAPMFSDPRLKTGVRPGFAEGGLTADELYDYLASKDADPREAALLTSGAGVESSFRPDVVHDKGTGYGLWGHRLDRYDAMKQFTGEDRPGWQKQADFALDELRHRPEHKMVMSATTPEELTRAQMYYERPAGFSSKNPEGGSQYDRRLASTRSLLNRGVSPLAFAETERPESGGALDAVNKMAAGQPSYSPRREPQGLSGFLRGKPADGMGEKALDFLTSERFIVPLLSGLGTMASSQSRFLAPAILQGIGAGAQTYGAMSQQDRLNEIERSKLSLEERRVGASEAGTALEGRKVNLLEREADRKARAAEAISKALSSEAGVPYSPPSAPPIKSAPSVSLETPKGPVVGLPSSSAPLMASGASPETGVPGEAPTLAAAPPPAMIPPAANTKVNGLPSPSNSFWAGVSPQSNPHVLNAAADRFERAASASMSTGDPEYAKSLLASAQQYRQAAQSVLKEGRVITTGGEVKLIPGFAEAAGSLKAQEQMATKNADLAMNPQITKAEEEAKAAVRGATEPQIVADTEEAKAKVARKYSPRVSPTGTEYMPSQEPVAAAPSASSTEPPASVPADRPEKATPDPATARVVTALPKAPPGGGMIIDRSLPPGAEVTKLSPQNSAIIAEDQKFFGDFMEKQPTIDTAIERYRSIAQAFKIAESGSTAQKRAAFAALAQTAGQDKVAQMALNGDPAAIGWVQKNALNAVLDTLKAATPRFAQQEFVRLSDQGVPNPDNLPRTNFQMAAETIGALERQRAFARDWEVAKGEWASPSAFWDKWSKANPQEVFVQAASRQLGNFKGMPLPPAKDWAQGSIYVVPESLNERQKATMARLGLKAGDLFKFGGWGENGEMKAARIDPANHYTAHLGGE